MCDTIYIMDPHILIQINKDTSNVSYIDTGDKLHSHDYGYGYADGKNKLKYISGILYMLEIVNTIDPIPNKIIIKFAINNNNKSNNIKNIDTSDMRHMKGWYADVLRNYNYTQFIMRYKSDMHVIIDLDERHKKHNQIGLRY